MAKRPAVNPAVNPAPPPSEAAPDAAPADTPEVTPEVTPEPVADGAEPDREPEPSDETEPPVDAIAEVTVRLLCTLDDGSRLYHAGTILTVAPDRAQFLLSRNLARGVSP